MDSRSVTRWSVVVCATRPFKTDCSESKTKARADSTRGDLAWLVQMGYQRGGLYRYGWLDRLRGFLDHPSATSVLPELQRLAGGDKIRLGPREELVVAALEPARALVLSYNAHGMEWVWQPGFTPLATIARASYHTGSSDCHAASCPS